MKKIVKEIVDYILPWIIFILGFSLFLCGLALINFAINIKNVIMNYNLGDYSDIFQITTIVLFSINIIVIFIYRSKKGKLREKSQKIEMDYKDKEKKMMESFEKKEKELIEVYNNKKRELDDYHHVINIELEKRNNSINELLRSNDIIDAVSSMYTHVHLFLYRETETYLRDKVRPATSTADKVKELRQRTQAYLSQYSIMLYKYEFLLKTFPELTNYVEDTEGMKELLNYKNFDDFKLGYDHSQDWLSKEEYANLKVNERNQLALDRYVKGHKRTKLQVGLDFELYIGHRFRKAKWNVLQNGNIEGLNDHGIDIIAKGTRNNIYNICIVQCKRWSENKNIHENSICQLYGTTIQYIMENNLLDKVKKGLIRVRSVFVTTAELSETATKFAQYLNVEVRVVKNIGDFPRIKCNINEKTGEKIYHLPFDQQYYRTQIKNIGERYVWTVNEAISYGFRRAFKHHSNNSQIQTP